MSSEELELIYRRYLARLNEHRAHDLSEFVQDRLTYNGQEWSRQEYERLLTEDVTTFPDLAYPIGLLVVQGPRVACRIDFDCTPVREWLGFQPNGKRISFSENVFYGFHQGRIQHVWSLLDHQAISRQMTS